MPQRRCPICQRLYRRDVPSLRSSRDHILPRSEGYLWDVLECGAANIRIMCVECNSLRGQAFHCVAALACARAIAERVGSRPGTVIAGWERMARQEQVA